MDLIYVHLDKAELLVKGRMSELGKELELIQRAKAAALARSQAKVDGQMGEVPGSTAIASVESNSHMFVVPKVDLENGEPIYDPRVVKGYRTHRQRVRALTRVYGPVIRGRSAGRAIFEAGETNAASVASAVANLNVLAKHRTGEFTRDGGSYTYHGELEPDLDMIALVSGEPVSVGEPAGGETAVESQGQEALDGISPPVPGTPEQ